MKKITCLLICTLMICSVFAVNLTALAQDEPVLVTVYNPESVRAGENIVITININTDTPVISGHVIVHYEGSAINAAGISVERGDFIPNQVMSEWYAGNAGRVEAAFAGNTPIDGEGEIFVFTFPTTTSNTASYADFEIEIREFIDQDTTTMLDYEIEGDTERRVPVLAANFAEPTLRLQVTGINYEESFVTIDILINNASIVGSGTLSVTHDAQAFEFSGAAPGADTTTIEAVPNGDSTQISFDANPAFSASDRIATLTYSIREDAPYSTYSFALTVSELYMDDDESPVSFAVGDPCSLTLSDSLQQFTATFYAYDRTTVIETVVVDEGQCAQTTVDPPAIANMMFIGYDPDPASTPLFSDMSFYAQYHFKGDVNLDNETNTGDASLLLRFAAGLVELTPEQEQYADVNIDGDINTGDASLLLRFAAGLVTELP